MLYSLKYAMATENIFNILRHGSSETEKKFQPLKKTREPFYRAKERIAQQIAVVEKKGTLKKIGNGKYQFLLISSIVSLFISVFFLLLFDGI